MKISQKSYNEESEKGFFLEVDVKCIEKVHELQTDLPFLPARMKVEKLESLQLIFMIYNIHIRNLKQALNHRLVLKKAHRVITFNQNAWSESDFDMDTDLRKM